eukprot:15447169-Alexandrium_andersonii.AAC.1
MDCGVSAPTARTCGPCGAGPAVGRSVGAGGTLVADPAVAAGPGGPPCALAWPRRPSPSWAPAGVR